MTNVLKLLMPPELVKLLDPALVAERKAPKVEETIAT
jgi:hypothetical protein